MVLKKDYISPILVYNPYEGIYIADRLPNQPNIRCALTSTKYYECDTFILTSNLNIIYLINNHIGHMSYQHNTPINYLYWL